jgi:hypothetical protein
LDPKEELAGDIGAAFAGGANVGTAIKVIKARAAMSVFMIRLHIWTICPRSVHRRVTNRPAPAGGNMCTPVPPRCDTDHNFYDDSERFRKAAAGGLLAFKSHPNERGTQRAEADLFALDVRGFEDRPPLLDLGPVVGRERLRILILARRNLLAEIGEPLAHAGIG